MTNTGNTTIGLTSNSFVFVICREERRNKEVSWWLELIQSCFDLNSTQILRSISRLDSSSVEKRAIKIRSTTVAPFVLIVEKNLWLWIFQLYDLADSSVF